MTQDPLRIGELATRARINAGTLRYYERIGLLIPTARTPAGYRVYRSKEADRLAFIRQAQPLGLSLGEIADIIALREAGTPPCPHVRAIAALPITAIDHPIADLAALRDQLVQLAERAAAVEAACRAGALGNRAVMVEVRTGGGTCGNRGCLPSKNLIEAAKLSCCAPEATEAGAQQRRERPPPGSPRTPMRSYCRLRRRIGLGSVWRPLRP